MPVLTTEECLELDQYLKQESVDFWLVELDVNDLPEFVQYFLNTIKSGNYPRTRDLLSEPGLNNIDACDNQGMTALSLAAQYGHVNIVALLLEYYPSVNAKDSKGRTPLMWAIENGHEEVVRLLLENNADVEIHDPQRNTPLHLAIEKNSLNIIELLLKHKANPEIPFREGFLKYYSPLTFAAYKNQVELFELLLKSGASVQGLDGRGVSPIEYIVFNLRYEFLKRLANHPDPEVRESVITFCVENNNSKVLKQFLENMPPEFKQSLFKDTTSSSDKPITMAFQKCRFICAKLLLNHGIDLIEPGKEASEDAVISRLNNKRWRSMLQAYLTKVGKHEKTSALTAMAANIAYCYGQRTNTPIKDFGLPIELRELCSEAPSRLDIKSRYTPSQQIKTFLKESLRKPNEEITKLIKDINKKKRRR
ncbi:MAG: ankyrin repeat domain-containing protein [Gammaproteobacteria bacterium]|jgi:hypothetical protein|nr:ankyrin repeat domain-containing protein [Gammaproteobacteria bacterium]